MRKETAWAIGIGVLFGLVLAFGVWRINVSIQNSTTKNEEVKNEVPASPSPEAQYIKINIENPENGDVVANDTILVEGVATANSKIVISGEDRDYLVNSDISGRFSAEVNLVGGINQITATSVLGGDTESSNVLIVYSTNFEKKDATQSASLKTKSYTGTVTDITDTSIQIKTLKNEIKQIAVNEDASVVNIKDTPSKEVKISDVAIGDSIAALGTIDRSLVLTASRVLVTKPTKEVDIKIASGKYTKGELTVDKNTVYYEIVDGETEKVKPTTLKEDVDIIYTQNDTLTRSIFVLPN